VPARDARASDTRPVDPFSSPEGCAWGECTALMAIKIAAVVSDRDRSSDARMTWAGNWANLAFETEKAKVLIDEYAPDLKGCARTSNLDQN
jgi:hypothetical protein